MTDLFPSVHSHIDNQLRYITSTYTDPSWQGLKDIQSIQSHFEIDDINLIKPGVGETTRVLLRRIPWKILICKQNNPDLKHILLLAKEKNVPIEIYENMTYSCCGLIKPLRRETL